MISVTKKALMKLWAPIDICAIDDERACYVSLDLKNCLRDINLICTSRFSTEVLGFI